MFVALGGVLLRALHHELSLLAPFDQAVVVVVSNHVNAPLMEERRFLRYPLLKRPGGPNDVRDVQCSA